MKVRTPHNDDTLLIEVTEALILQQSEERNDPGIRPWEENYRPMCRCIAWTARGARDSDAADEACVTHWHTAQFQSNRSLPPSFKYIHAGIQTKCAPPYVHSRGLISVLQHRRPLSEFYQRQQTPLALPPLC
eukprot:scaffold251242_cov26-Tisochrysis_lutea.AAC.1